MEDIIRIKSFCPLRGGILTTLERNSVDVSDGGVIGDTGSAGMVRNYQRVIRVGSSVRNIKEGDVVLLDLSHYVREVYKEDSIRGKMGEYSKELILDLSRNVIKVGGVECGIFEDLDVIGIIEEYE